MALDVAESLLEVGELDGDHLARRFAASYRWSRGYGPGTAKLLKRVARGEDWRRVNRAIYPDGSFGNGAAMRAPVIGLFYAKRPDELVEAARLSARVTHTHPLGVEGAVLIATTVALAAQSRDPLDILAGCAARCEHEAFANRLTLAESWLRAGDAPGAVEVARRLGNGVAAAESCVTSLHVGLRFLDEPFEAMMAFLIDCGGDVDTLGAMAGAVWGVARGVSNLPADRLERLEDKERLERVAHALYERAPQG